MAEELAMHFFVEETSFMLPAGIDAAVIERHLDAFISLVNARHKQGEDVFRWSKLLGETEVQPGTLLVDVLYQELEHLPLDKDTKLGLMQALNRCVEWDDRIEKVPDPRVDIDGVGCEAPTVAVVHSRISARSGAACLALGARTDRSGVHIVRSGDSTREIHFVTHEAALPLFYRTLFEIEELDADAYMKNAPRAFPEIAFVPGLAEQFSRFDTKYRDVRRAVTKHLGALNDHFPRLIKKHNGQTPLVIAELSAYCHVDASPEGPKTHANKAAMRERDVEIDTVIVGHREVVVGRKVRCEWHTKIEPDADRIHFHPGDTSDDKVAEGRLVVGIFANHLTT